MKKKQSQKWGGVTPDGSPYVCVHLHHRCILSGGNPHLHRSTVQIWFALPQVQPLTVEINTHVTSASVCLVSFVRDNFIDLVGSGCQQQQQQHQPVSPEPSGESPNLGFSDFHIC